MKYLSPASWDWLVAKAQRHQCSQHPSHWVWTGLSRAECRDWTGYKRDCEHNGRLPPCTLGSMWRHARTAQTDTPCIHTDRLEHWSESESRLKQTRSTVRLSAVVTTLADSQRRMQTSGRSRDSRAGIFFRT